nr:MAG TPA: hypothetical protein [Caudoviricetes sp.]
MRPDFEAPISSAENFEWGPPGSAAQGPCLDSPPLFWRSTCGFVDLAAFIVRYAPYLRLCAEQDKAAAHQGHGLAWSRLVACLRATALASRYLLASSLV